MDNYNDMSNKTLHMNNYNDMCNIPLHMDTYNNMSNIPLHIDNCNNITIFAAINNDNVKLSFSKVGGIHNIFLLKCIGY